MSRTADLIVAWTGHRPDLFADPAAAWAEVDAAAHQLALREGATRFLVGGQRGVDTWAALAAFALHVPLTVILPLEPADFADDEWSDDDRARLDRILTRAQEVRVIGGDRLTAYSERNRALATESHLLVTVWTRTAGGGTAETIDFAHQQHVPVREIVLEPAARSGAARGRGI